MIKPSHVRLLDYELEIGLVFGRQMPVGATVTADTLAADMLYRPVEALQTLTGFQRLDPGDLLLTGTPVGTAISAPPKPVQVIASVLPPAVKWKSLLDSQARNPKYLHDGDVIEATVATGDGASTWAPNAQSSDTPMSNDSGGQPHRCHQRQHTDLTQWQIPAG